MVRKVGRPKGKKTKTRKVKDDCHKITVYRKHKGRVQKVKGVRKKSCLKKKK